MGQKITGVGSVGSYGIVKICRVDKNGKEIEVLGYGVLSPNGSLRKGKNGRSIFSSFHDANDLAEEMNQLSPAELPHKQPSNDGREIQ